MQVNIQFNWVKGPSGGANQFLQKLKRHFEEKDMYTSDIEKSTVVILNSSPDNFRKLWLRSWWKSQKYDIALINRIDGPVSLIRGKFSGRIYDKCFQLFSRYLANYTIFQSRWSASKMLEYGNVGEYSIISNGSNRMMEGFVEIKPGAPLKVLISTWSDNKRKGFDYYRKLDDWLLKVQNIEVEFIGNTAHRFKVIKDLGVMDHDELLHKMSDYDIYITASENDPCSNSLIEAVACGLIPLTLDSGGHPEIIKDPSLTFNNFSGLTEILEHIQKRGYVYYPHEEINIGNAFSKYEEIISYVKCRNKKIFPSVLLVPILYAMTSISRVLEKLDY